METIIMAIATTNRIRRLINSMLNYFLYLMFIIIP
jgi:hypothetical protein